MRSTGIVRSLDDLGRIVIPKEIRNRMNWKPNTRIEILLEEERISLREFTTQCSVCGEETIDLHRYKEANLCSSCMSKFNT